MKLSDDYFFGHSDLARACGALSLLWNDMNKQDAKKRTFEGDTLEGSLDALLEHVEERKTEIAAAFVYQEMHGLLTQDLMKGNLSSKKTYVDEHTQERNLFLEAARKRLDDASHNILFEEREENLNDIVQAGEKIKRIMGAYAVLADSSEPFFVQETQYHLDVFEKEGKMREYNAMKSKQRKRVQRAIDTNLLALKEAYEQEYAFKRYGTDVKSAALDQLEERCHRYFRRAEKAGVHLEKEEYILQYYQEQRVLVAEQKEKEEEEQQRRSCAFEKSVDATRSSLREPEQVTYLQPTIFLGKPIEAAIDDAASKEKSHREEEREPNAETVGWIAYHINRIDAVPERYVGLHTRLCSISENNAGYMLECLGRIGKENEGEEKYMHAVHGIINTSYTSGYLHRLIKRSVGFGRAKEIIEKVAGDIT